MQTPFLKGTWKKNLLVSEYQNRGSLLLLLLLLLLFVLFLKNPVSEPIANLRESPGKAVGN